ncbi:hypothetical protein LIER_37427 [Lithospermum erythrorhizon]|uniref:Uncharacterized protein n=1 Tax=Lithospermum erythrorhizon TaxID=34254 RepID=A0AAV3PN15_LITER
MSCEVVCSFVESSETPHNEKFDELRTEEIDKGGHSGDEMEEDEMKEDDILDNTSLPDEISPLAGDNEIRAKEDTNNEIAPLEMEGDNEI